MRTLTSISLIVILLSGCTTLATPTPPTPIPQPTVTTIARVVTATSTLQPTVTTIARAATATSMLQPTVTTIARAATATSSPILTSVVAPTLAVDLSATPMPLPTATIDPLETTAVSGRLIALEGSQEWLFPLELKRRNLPNPLLLADGQFIVLRDGWQVIQLSATETTDLVTAVLGPNAILCRDTPIGAPERGHGDRGTTSLTVYQQVAPCNIFVIGPSSSYRESVSIEGLPVTEEGQQRFSQFQAAYNQLNTVVTTFEARIESYRANQAILFVDPNVRMDADGYAGYGMTGIRQTPQPWPFATEVGDGIVVAGDEAAALVDFAWKPTLITVGDQTLWVIALPILP